jgi:hypothetical protein
MKQSMLGNTLTYRKYLDVVEEKEETSFKRKKSELGKLKKETKHDLRKTKTF